MSWHNSVLRPPPISAFTRPTSPHSTRPASGAVTDNEHASLARREKAVQQSLQDLLDAQADGLLAGLGISPSSVEDEWSTTRSASPSPYARASKVMPVRQPPETNITLASARRGIWDAMRQLASIKMTESDIVAASIDQYSGSLDQIDVWDTKRKGLHAEIAGLEIIAQEGRLTELKSEDGSLQSEIDVLEARLAELKSHQRAVRVELNALDNSMQSKLSSFRASLALVNKDVASFLASPPPMTTRTEGADRKPDGDVDNEANYLKLRPERRTLNMAKAFVQTVRKDAEKRVESIDVERKALEEGANLWNDVIGEISGFEKHLKREIRRLGGGEGQESHEQGADELLIRMNETIKSVQNKLELSESRGWNLLVVAMSAELDAFKQGKDLLQASLGVSVKPAKDVDAPSDDFHVKESRDQIQEQEKHVSLVNHSKAADEDGPDPDLLISQQDTDEE